MGIKEACFKTFPDFSTLEWVKSENVWNDSFLTLEGFSQTFFLFWKIFSLSDQP